MADKKPAVKVRLYRFKNRLKEKAAGLGGDGGVGIDVNAIEAAEENLRGMAEEYPDWVMVLIKQMQDAHRRCVDTPEKRKTHFEEINAVAHDMRGQGGTFGYHLITQMADSLYEFTGPYAGTGDNHVEIVKAHLDAMFVVIKQRMSGDGGEVGKQLLEGMGKAIEKHSKTE